jgi:hypothetical protein
MPNCERMVNTGDRLASGEACSLVNVSYVDHCCCSLLAEFSRWPLADGSDNPIVHVVEADSNSTHC